MTDATYAVGVGAKSYQHTLPTKELSVSPTMLDAGHGTCVPCAVRWCWVLCSVQSRVCRRRRRLPALVVRGSRWLIGGNWGTCRVWFGSASLSNPETPHRSAPCPRSLLQRRDLATPPSTPPLLTPQPPTRLSVLVFAPTTHVNKMVFYFTSSGEMG